MVRHTRFQYQAAKRAVFVQLKNNWKGMNGSLAHKMYKWPSLLLGEKSGGYTY